MKKTLLITAFIAVCHSSFAQKLFTENFDYPAGPLDKTNSGWFAYNAEGAQPAEIISPGLTFSGYKQTSGNSMKLNPKYVGAEDIYKEFSKAVKSGPTYVAFLLNVTSSAVVPDNQISEFLSLSTKPKNMVLRAKVSTTDNGNNTFKLKLTWGMNTAESKRSEETFIYGKTYLIVLKYVRQSGADEASLYVFDKEAPTSEPIKATIEKVSYTNESAEIAPGSILLQQLGGAQVPQNITIDGITAAITWDDLFN
jgi:hypothetical protein